MYYCCAQSSLVPNRFFAMESARNRIMGVLMYLYGICLLYTSLRCGTKRAPFPVSSGVRIGPFYHKTAPE